jgi:single-stranded DNA-binding protein
MGSLTVNGIARITRDSEVRKTNNGTWYNFGIAVFRKNAKEGKQNVDFFECELYQKAPTPGFENSLHKGRLIFIESAYLRNDQFTGTDGKEKSRVKLQVSAFDLLNDKVEDEKKPEVKSVAEKPKPATTHPSDLGVPIDVPKKPVPAPDPVPVEKAEEPVAYDFNNDEPPF